MMLYAVLCLGTFNWYDQLLLFVLVPLLVVAALVLLYLIPLYYLPCCQEKVRPRSESERRNSAGASSSGSPTSSTSRSFERIRSALALQGALNVSEADRQMMEDRLAADHAERVRRKRVRRNFWKMLFFVLFLVYPTVSSTVLRTYVCKDIEGESYMVADFTQKCYTECVPPPSLPSFSIAIAMCYGVLMLCCAVLCCVVPNSIWMRTAYLLIPVVLVYPIGIPAFFGAMLYRYRHRLMEAGVRAELGVSSPPLSLGARRWLCVFKLPLCAWLCSSFMTRSTVSSGGLSWWI
jgi:hypothetical protein